MRYVALCIITLPLGYQIAAERTHMIASAIDIVIAVLFFAFATTLVLLAVCLPTLRSVKAPTWIAVKYGAPTFLALGFWTLILGWFQFHHLNGNGMELLLIGLGGTTSLYCLSKVERVIDRKLSEWMGI